MHIKATFIKKDSEPLYWYVSLQATIFTIEQELSMLPFYKAATERGYKFVSYTTAE